MPDTRELIATACELGASTAVIMSSKDIAVDDGLAERCREPRCGNYGLARSCPPHVAGPAAFRELLAVFHQALVFKIDVPAEMLFSSESRELFRLLHETASGIERAAVQAGFAEARAFAGGSCKSIFCHDRPDCPALLCETACRHAESARPSMSGFGIDVAKLFAAAGWQMHWASRDAGAPPTKMASLCGLVLLRKPEAGNRNARI